LRHDLPHRVTPLFYDFLTDDLRNLHGIDDIGPESANEYDPDALAMFARHAGGLMLDVGAGYRSTYLDDVVNFEIAPFATTDVRGVAESLPFVDASFEAVISIAVLEHVRDPFRAAAEIVRVLKPGAELICCVPFLQPLHGYPHHYYNMTHEGLRRLFEPHLIVDRITTPDSTLPIWSISWILRNWSDALPANSRSAFLDLKLGELIADPNSYLDQPWVRQLPPEKNLELASATVLIGRKAKPLAAASPSRTI
jgi:SAM-dependent methyltransferase